MNKEIIINIILYSSLLVMAFSSVLYNFITFIKSLHLYLREDGSLGTCFVAQITVFFIIFAAEAGWYMFTGNMNQFCICSCKIFPLIVSFLFVCGKFIGKPSIRISSSIKNILFIIVCTIFYISLACISLSLKETPELNVIDGGFLSFDRITRLVYALKYDCFDNTEKIVRLFPIQYIITIIPSVFFITAFIIDILEKVEKKNKAVDILMLISCLLFIHTQISKVPTTKIGEIFEIYIMYAMYVLPIFGFAFESKLLETKEDPNVILIRKVYCSYKNSRKSMVYKSQKRLVKRIIDDKDSNKNVQKELNKRKYKNFLRDFC